MSKNIIFILADDMGEWALGKRCPDAITPNLDKMCDDGSYFENFYCASPVCSPARASIITGTYPSTHGIHDWIRSGNVDINDPMLSLNLKNSNEYKDENECIDYLSGLPSYLEFFKNKGYNTALFGKWHLGNSVNCGGFDTHTNIIRGGCSYYKADVLRNNEITFESEYITDIITNDAIEYIKKQSNEQPFYISVHYTAPHSPWGEKEHPQQYFNMYRNCLFNSVPNLAINPKQIATAPIGDTEEKRLENLRGYFAAITAMDNCIGKILLTLEEKGLLENTEIIFTSDNGMNMGHHGIWGKGNGTYPQNMYETSVKVPFIRYLKGQKPKVYKECYSHVDILPVLTTISSLALSNSERIAPTPAVIPSTVDNLPSNKASALLYSAST